MISKLTFGSTYKVSSKDNDFTNILELKQFISEKNTSNNIHTETKDKLSPKYPYDYQVDYTVVAPNQFDDAIEMFCAHKGIEYIKTSPSMGPTALSLRIDSTPRGMNKAFLNVKNLEKFLQNQETNISLCEDDYNKYFKTDIEFLLKKGEKFPATTFVINSRNGVDDTLTYIRKFGADLLNDEQVFIGFDQRTNMPDHCIFFALRDKGMTNIPVYVSQDTLKIGSALGILNV